MLNQKILVSNNGWSKVYINNYPDYCPYCQAHIRITSIDHTAVIDDSVLQFALSCPKCKKLFIAEYKHFPEEKQHLVPTELNFEFTGLAQPEIKTKEHDNILKNAFPKVVEILSQAEKAEKFNLAELAGMGYRKALEFLIKDFVLRKIDDPMVTVKIKEMRLSNVIEHNIQHEKIKAFAKRAVWLGNDEVHYDRRWIEKDIKDLKNLVDLTISYITTEIMGEQYINEMPD